MISNLSATRPLAVALGLAAAAGAASATTVQVSITNLQGPDGAYLTPLLGVFHDGSYRGFTPGTQASASLQTLAETGNPAPAIAAIDGAYATAVLANPAGFGGAPVIDPGETATATVQLNPTQNIFFSYLSMIIPTNDIFIGNANAQAFRLFDAEGNFTNPGSIDIRIADAWDAGTESNILSDVAFGVTTGARQDEGAVVSGGVDLSYLDGIQTAAGTTFSAPNSSSALATITFTEVDVAPVPLPAGLPLLGAALGLLGLARRRNC